tara:strand:- start:90993 stop:91589 length:597 start_codon:yes stop_codon:yes gene_type:complete
MVHLAELWMPLLITSVVVFFASAIMWMAMPHHKKDINFVGDKEPGFLDALKSTDLKAGFYLYPGCEAKDLKTDEGKAKWDAGPWGSLIVSPGKPNFGMNLVKTFVVYAIITVFVAYITGHSVPAGAEYMHVFRVAGTTAILGHCMGGLVNDFFLGKPTRFIVTCFIDGLVYALLTAGIFAAMWPAAVASGALDGIVPG